MGLWHNIKVRLGLEDDWDDEYYDDDHDNDVAGRDDSGEDDFYGQNDYESPHGSGGSDMRKIARDPDMERGRRGDAHLRSVPSDNGVSQMAPKVKMHIVEPKSFTEAQAIADKFRQGTPVIMNMSMTQPDLAKRLLDFASGLTYGLNGGLQKISDKVFMLTPANVDVSAGEVRRMTDRGMFTVE